jgi:drug/metabolite transporter (DMT)-like permease
MWCCLLALKLCPELGTKSRKTKGTSIYGDSILEYNGYSRKDELMFLLLGICMAGNFGGFVLASSMLPALTCSIFAPLIPVGTALISIAWGKEEKHQTKLGGLALAVLGAMIVVIYEDHAKAPEAPWLPGHRSLDAHAYHHPAHHHPVVANATIASLANATVKTVTNATLTATNASAANATAIAAKTAVAAVAAVPNKTGAVVRAAAPVVAKAVEHSNGGSWKLLGYSCLFLCTFSAAMYFVLLKDVLKTYTPVRATALAYSHATGLIFVGCLARYWYDPLAWFLYGDIIAWFVLIYAGTVTTGLTYTIQAWAVGITSPSTVTAFTTLSPVAAAMISSVVLDIHLQTYQIVGGAMICFGLWINVSVQAQENARKEKVPLMKPTDYGNANENGYSTL